jgi:2-amino-4-hydroxy-6-hydroxymethyldihydropteridine diphosphokinase
MTDTHTIFLGLGSNLGDKEKNLKEAIKHIEKLFVHVVCQSAFHVSEPWGFESDNFFVNAVVECQSSLSPRQLLRTTQQIEKLMGRTKKSNKGIYSDRIIDIDILLYDDWHINYPDLIIPHPLMRKRDFVMIPLQEIMQKKSST